MTARAGWYPDPAGHPDQYRWWDGSAWTRFLTADPTAPEPLVTDQPARHQATDPSPWQRAGAVIAAEGSAGRAAEGSPGRDSRPPGYERPVRPDGARRRSSLKPALLGIGALALVALIVLAIALFGNPAPQGLEPPAPQDDGSGPASPTPEASASTGGSKLTYDPVTRRFAMDGLVITMPAAPYTVSNGSGYSDLGGAGVSASAPVHKNYDGKGNVWAATVSVGQVGRSLVGKDLNDTADKIISNWAATEFDGSKVSIKGEKKTTITKNEPRPARIVTADLHYKVKGVASTYDHVSLLVAKGPSGNYVGFISSRPGDADAKIKKSLTDSINTIHLV